MAENGKIGVVGAAAIGIGGMVGGAHSRFTGGGGHGRLQCVESHADAWVADVREGVRLSLKGMGDTHLRSAFVHQRRVRNRLASDRSFLALAGSWRRRAYERRRPAIPESSYLASSLNLRTTSSGTSMDPRDSAMFFRSSPRSPG